MPRSCRPGPGWGWGNFDFTHFRLAFWETQIQSWGARQFYIDIGLGLIVINIIKMIDSGLHKMINNGLMINHDKSHTASNSLWLYLTFTAANHDNVCSLHRSSCDFTRLQSRTFYRVESSWTMIDEWTAGAASCRQFEFGAVPSLRLHMMNDKMLFLIAKQKISIPQTVSNCPLK